MAPGVRFRARPRARLRARLRDGRRFGARVSVSVVDVMERRPDAARTPLDASRPVSRRASGAVSGAVIWWAVLTALVGAVLLTWVLAVPRFASPDEPAHFYKAYGTAHGQLLGSGIPGLSSNLRLYDVPQGLGPGDLSCVNAVLTQSFGCVTLGVGETISSASPYPPYYYAAIGVPAAVVGAAGNPEAYRLLSALVVAGLLAAAMAVLRRRVPWAAPLVLVATTPMAWFMFATVNPNAWEIAAFALAWVLAWSLAAQPTQRTAWAFGAVAAAVVLLRPVALAWLIPLVVVTAIAAAPTARRALLTRGVLMAIGLPVAAAAVASYAWLRYADFTIEDNRTIVESSAGATVSATVDRYGEYLMQTMGVFGWADTPLPWIGGALVAVAATGWLLVFASRARLRQWMAFAVLLGAWSAFPIAINLLTAPTAGLSWQGRYGLPLVAGLCVLPAFGDDRSTAVSQRLTNFVVRGAVAASLLAQTVGLWWMVRRYAVGIDGPLFPIGSTPWSPAIAPMLLVALNAVAASALGWFVLRTRR